MNWSLIILGLVALSSVAYATNSYLIIVPNLLKVGDDNQISVFVAAASQPVEVTFNFTLAQNQVIAKTICKPGETRNVTLTLPQNFPVGAGELIITGTGGLSFVEKRVVIVYDNRHVLLVQTCASSYRPHDTMEIRVVATNEDLFPLQNGELIVEIYDAALKLVGQFPHVSIQNGLTETLQFPIASHPTTGTWLVSATLGNTTSSVQVLVSRPVTPSFDLKAIFQRFLLRTDKILHGIIEIDCDNNEPIFGRATIAIGQITKQEMQSKMPTPPNNNEWRQWKSQEVEIAGRLELNYDLMSLFNVDVTTALAVQVYIQVTDLTSGHERVIQHIIPVFNRDVIYDIRPLEFQAGVNNEYEVIAKRPDGKPVKMENMIVTVQMILNNQQGTQPEEKFVEIKDFYTRGRNDIGFFNLVLPENCIGVLMTITPLDESGNVRGYRTQPLALMPTPNLHGAKLSIELLPSTVAPTHTNVNVPVVSSQISTVGRTSNFYIQLIPTKSVNKFEPLPMSYVLMTNGRITLTGQFTIQPTKECQTMTPRAIVPEQPTPPTCVFNGTLPIQITRDMIPYSTLLVYTFQPSFGFSVAESYRFSVAGLFQNPLTLNATIVPFTPSDIVVNNFGFLKGMNVTPIQISSKVQDKTRVELSFTGVPDSTVGLNVFEYDGILQGLSNEITKERLLQYLTIYEQVPVGSVSPIPLSPQSTMSRRSLPSKPKEKREETEESKRTISEEDEEKQIAREQSGYQARYPVEQMIFGVSSLHQSAPVEGDDVYTSSNMEQLYGNSPNQRSPAFSHYRRKFQNSVNQYDVTVDNNGFVIATSMPLIFTATPSTPPTPPPQNPDAGVNTNEQSFQYGTPSWYAKINTKLSAFSQEAFTFMQSGLSVVSDFELLQLPVNVNLQNWTNSFSNFYTQSLINQQSFSVRDTARQLLEEYVSQSNLSIVPPAIMLEEQTRISYYRSVFFNTSSIPSQGTGKVVLPQIKPYSTWLATGFSLNQKSGLSIAQPIRLPASQGLFVLADFPRQIQVGEHVLLSYGVNNYLTQDLTNVIVRIRASNDFDLIQVTKPEQVVSTPQKDYTVTIPSMKTLAVQTYQMIVVPKRTGVIQIVVEVESQFGGDYEILPVFVRESNLTRREVSVRLLDLTNGTTTYGPFVEKITPTPTLRSVRLAVSGTGLDRFVNPFTIETNSLVGIDRALVRLYRSLGLRQYLNQTSQTNSPLFNVTWNNITTAYQRLQLYNDYDGSYSFISDEGIQHSSLYLTSLAFGALINPMMPVRDNVTLNRTLNWILSHQQADGSFDDNGSCFHYRFCAGQFRRESLTAIVLYSLTRDNSSDYLPGFIYQRLYNGTNSPLYRAQSYLVSRVPDVLPHVLTISLFEMAFIQNRTLSSTLREKIHQALLGRKLTVAPEDGSRYINNTNANMTFDDQLLVNAMTISLYASFGDYRTSSDIARWVVSQIQVHPHYDTVLDAVFRTGAWLSVDCLFRRQFDINKFGITVDVTADNGQKQQFTINSGNLDFTQLFNFTLPVNQITYSVRGFGLASVALIEKYAEPTQQPTQQALPFQLTHTFTPMSWLSEITAKTCVTYTPTPNDQQLVTGNFNRTIVVEVELPSGTRINMRQVGFFLSRVEEVMYFTYEPCGNRLIFFLNVPTTTFGQPICFQWCLERLSTVVSWSPIQIRVYDYLQQEIQLAQLFPVQFQPNVLGYSFVDAIHQARPSLQSLTNSPKSPQV